MKQLPMNINVFTELLISKLAQQSEIFKNSDMKVAKLPDEYKEKIKMVLFLWPDTEKIFSSLIDVERYFLNNTIWEENFSTAINDFIYRFNLDCEYNFELNRIEIAMKKDIINKITAKFKDTKYNDKMNCFLEAMNDIIFSKNYREETFDYYPLANEKVKTLSKRPIETQMVSIVLRR